MDPQPQHEHPLELVDLKPKYPIHEEEYEDEEENPQPQPQPQHEHPLELVDLQPKYPNHEEEYEDEEEEEDEDEDEDDDLITKWDFVRPCNRCNQKINVYHRYYYKCSYSCDYSLHKFCGELPATLKQISNHNHRYATDHDPEEKTLTLCQVVGMSSWCFVCQYIINDEELLYCCIECRFSGHVKCALGQLENPTIYGKMIYHPSHPHPLVIVNSNPNLCKCDACGKRHMGIFYHCTTCFCHSIHSDCAFLPRKLETQHTHPLKLSYSFPVRDQKANFYPDCRICACPFDNEKLWIYKCEKCRYYAHLDCATSREEPFMSIFLSAGAGETTKNFEDADHPDLVHLPFPDQTYSRLQQLFETKQGNLNHICHQHPLCLVHAQTNDVTRPSSSTNHSLACHNPMKKIQVLCNGCLRPIMNMPFYKCTNEGQCSNFVLHEWCTRLPAEVQNHPGHPHHTLVLLPNVPKYFLGVFRCRICRLLCNGFVYGCIKCDYYVDVNCGFIPEKITHDAHPNHLLLLRVQQQQQWVRHCAACLDYIFGDVFSFSCVTCDFRLHIACALLLSRTTRHKLDKHTMNLKYLPIENHKSQYFCEICEEELDPNRWFYHCDECVQSMHTSCVSVILRYEENAFRQRYYNMGVHEFLNIKFGGIHNIEDHPHALSFAPGIKRDGYCAICPFGLKDHMILKCLKCKFARHYDCSGRSY